MANSYRIFTDQNYAYFVTWTLVQWLPILAEAPYSSTILDSLAYLRLHKKTELNAFVVMPSHLHAILWPAEGGNLSDVIRDFKRFTSRAISSEAERQRNLTALKCFADSRHRGRVRGTSRYQVWQEGSHPEAIYSRHFAQQKLDYIHMNPVRAGLVDTPVQWTFSSASAYLLGKDTYPPTDIIAF